MRKYTANEIVAALEKIDELLRQGVPAAEAVQTLGITAVTYYRWRKQFGGLSDDQAGLLSELRAENARLRRTIAELSLDRSVLLEIVKKDTSTPLLRRALVEHVQAEFGISERRACRVLGQHRSTQRKKPKSRNGYHAGGAAAML